MWNVINKMLDIVLDCIDMNYAAVVASPWWFNPIINGAIVCLRFVLLIDSNDRYHLQHISFYFKISKLSIELK